LAADGIRLKVWTNHGGPENVQNLLRPGALGDVTGSPTYLSDLAVEYGIRHVWASELTPVVGQNREISPGEYYAAWQDGPLPARWLARAAHGWSDRLVRSTGIE